MLKTESAITEEFVNALNASEEYFIEFTRRIAGVAPIPGVNKQIEKKLVETLNTQRESAAAAAIRKQITGH